MFKLFNATPKKIATTRDRLNTIMKMQNGEMMTMDSFGALRRLEEEPEEKIEYGPQPNHYNMMLGDIANDEMEFLDRNINLEEMIYSKEEVARFKSLKKMGFNLFEIQNIEAREAAFESQVDILRTLKYYKINYPLNKFISFEGIDSICHKYRLALGIVEQFNGKIPLENQEEIIAFTDLSEKLLKEDYIPKETGAQDKQLDHLQKLRIAAPIEMINERRFNSFRGDQSYLEQKFEGNKRKFTHQEQARQSLIPDDPIVLQPVKFGYLIITAWGPEANDEQIINGLTN